MAAIDPYIRTMFFRDAGELKFPSGYRRRDELMPHLRARLEELLAANGAPETITNIENLSNAIFDELVSANVIVLEDHGFAGTYFVFNKIKFVGYRDKLLPNDGISHAAGRVGSRYFRDMFEGYIRQQTIEDAEDALRGSIAVPASDRIVSLGDNVKSIIEEIEELKRSISSDNDADGKLFDRRERLVSELSAGQELLKAPSVRAKAILAVLVSTLGFIAAEFAGRIIGDLAVKLLEQIKPLMGL